MKTSLLARRAFVPFVLAMAFISPTFAAQPDAASEIHIDVPVALKQAKVVFNMDHAAFGGDTPVGLAHMTMMIERFKQIGTQWKMAAIFHGDAGYMLLNDETYNAVRKTKTGNPYKSMIQNLIAQGVEVEECAVTMKGNKWANANLLAGVKVNTGADGRIIDLVQQGYVMLQP